MLEAFEFAGNFCVAWTLVASTVNVTSARARRQRMRPAAAALSPFCCLIRRIRRRIGGIGGLGRGDGRGISGGCLGIGLGGVAIFKRRVGFIGCRRSTERGRCVIRRKRCGLQTIADKFRGIRQSIGDFICRIRAIRCRIQPRRHAIGEMPAAAAVPISTNGISTVAAAVMSNAIAVVSAAAAAVFAPVSMPSVVAAAVSRPSSTPSSVRSAESAVIAACLHQ